jgi:hypothetical protein
VRAIANEKISVFFQHTPVTIEKGEEVSGELAALMLRTAPMMFTRSDEPEPQAPPAELDIEAVAADILAWVGEDPDRASEALDAELAKDKPRSTLVKQLEKLAAADGE